MELSFSKESDLNAIEFDWAGENDWKVWSSSIVPLLESPSGHFPQRTFLMLLL